jgi:hypothetical protein
MRTLTALSLLSLAFAAGCSTASSDTASAGLFGEDGAAPEDGSAPEDGAAPDDAMGEAPPSCESDADCTDGCPPEALDCVCVEDDNLGEQVCAPTCEVDSDCPAPPDGADVSCDQATGVCVPDL